MVSGEFRPETPGDGERRVPPVCDQQKSRAAAVNDGVLRATRVHSLSRRGVLVAFRACYEDQRYHYTRRRLFAKNRKRLRLRRARVASEARPINVILTPYDNADLH